MPLTITEIKDANAGNRDYRLADVNGLYLYERTSGGKSWRYDYHFGVRFLTVMLGRYSWYFQFVVEAVWLCPKR